MLNMKVFRKLLVSPSLKQDLHLKALIALTRVNQAQLVAMTSGLAWQYWSSLPVQSTAVK